MGRPICKSDGPSNYHAPTDKLRRISVIGVRPQLPGTDPERFRYPRHGAALRAALALQHHSNGRLADADAFGKLDLGHATLLHHVAKALREGRFLAVHAF